MNTTPAHLSKPSPVDAADERWSLKIDGHYYGPVPRAELENFLRPPRLCSVMEVRCEDGNWFTISRHDTLDKVLAKVGIEPEKTPEPSRLPTKPSRLSGASAWLRDFAEGLFAWLVYHRLIVGLVLLIAAANGAFLFAMRDPHVREREILARYEALWGEVEKMAVSPAEPPSDEAIEQWRAFASQARAELEPLMSELEHSASVQQPVRQNLLFAGRDHLWKILKAERPPARDDAEMRLFARRLKLARQQLPDPSQPPPAPSSKGNR